MIPADLASRLRVLIESSVQPASQVQEIPAGLPRFEAGDRFSALIQAVLPDGSFQALVAGKTLTLALPESARSGDVLELIVTAQRGETVFARQAAPSGQAAAPADAQPHSTLSQTGQLISQLLTGRFGESSPTPLSSTGAALTTTPQNTAELTATLRQAVSSSGLFYESHLRQWVDGKLALAQLQQEPQARQSPLTPRPPSLPLSTEGGSSSPGLQTTVLPDEAPSPGTRTMAEGNLRPFGAQAVSGPHDGDAPQPATLAPGDAEAPTRTGSHAVADPLMPLVQRQLDTLATHQMSWAGQVWPGVQMQWDIFDPDDHSAAQQGDEDDGTAKFWRSALRLTMPNLGNVEVRLVLSPQGLKVSIDTDKQETASEMRNTGTTLQNSLETSGVHLLQLKVSSHERA